MLRVTRIIAFGLGLLGAGTASQAPEFAQQYRQRLGGAIDELNRVVERFDADARTLGETRESAIARLRGNADDFVSRQGTAMQVNVARLNRLAAHRHAMIEAGPFSRIALMVREGNRDVMRAAYRDFEPAVPVTEEGFVSAAIGFFAVWGGILLLGSVVRTLRRRSRRLKATATTARA